MTRETLSLYDTTLRDGAQTHGVDFSLEDKLLIAEQLDRLGMEVVPVELRDAYAFGGGLHCCTADVRREGGCEDYFPVA